MKFILRFLLVLSIAAFTNNIWAQEIKQMPSEDQKSAFLIGEGIFFTSTGKPNAAIDDFDKAAALYEQEYKDEKVKIYAARSQAEALMYLLEAANAKTSAKVASMNWPNAYYFKAYTLTEMGRIGEAKESLVKAISLSPRNSQFLSELGHIYQLEKNWPLALQTFKSAETAAKEFSPPQLKNAELSRAWRGMGYVYVEQKKLDDAEKMYRQCLQLDPNDKRAQSELEYVQVQRAKLKQKLSAISAGFSLKKLFNRV